MNLRDGRIHMAKKGKRPENRITTKQRLIEVIRQAAKRGAAILNLAGEGIFELPEEIGQLTNLQALKLQDNQLTSLPDSIAKLINLERLDLGGNNLTSLPKAIGRLTNLRMLSITGNQFAELPESIAQLKKLEELYGYSNQFAELPEPVIHLKKLKKLSFFNNQLTSLPDSIAQLTDLEGLYLYNNQLTSLPDSIAQLTKLQTLRLDRNQLRVLPEWIAQLTNLRLLDFSNNTLVWLPKQLAMLAKLETLKLDNNPLHPALQSAYDAGLDSLRSYLLSLEEPEERELLYEAKLVFVGEGDVGKTTLLKALTGKEPKQGETTTRGVSIERQAMHLSHPEKDDIQIQFNAWDFGGQEIYRVTHQFFFSRRSVYLVVWEPRRGVQQCQVADWLRLIRLRVGEDARVIVVSTHCRTGGRIARIDKDIVKRDFPMIVDFLEVDSLTPDPQTGEMVGIAELKALIAETAKDLEQMAMPFNRDWREARDEILALPDPRITYEQFAAICAAHKLNAIATKTLADLMHDLGYIVFYSTDERLKTDVVLQPEWLTKAISFVLEDRATQEFEGILPDARLKEVWQDHTYGDEPRYESSLYPFFLRLMEKYDVLYRLEDGIASLVAQHVPQVRPSLPWLPEEDLEEKQRRLAMVCKMDEAPPGLVPWMIVRTHPYAYQRRSTDGNVHRLHWQKGMFLRYDAHGEALLELRDREFHVYTQAVWPVYFMNLLKETLQKLIKDNWPGLEGRYKFRVPCRELPNNIACSGSFDIDALHDYLKDGDETIRCEDCRKRQDIVGLLYGFEDESLKEQLQHIKEKLEGLESRIANYVMAIMQAMANEAKHGPRFFTLQPAEGWKTFLTKPLLAKRYRLQLWCEGNHYEQAHPVIDEGKGIYEFDTTSEWVRRIAPYANFIAGVLKTLLPLASPTINLFLGDKGVENLGIKEELEFMKEGTGKLLPEIQISDSSRLRQGVLSEEERSGLLALHAILRDKDPHQEKLGLLRVPTYTGDYQWLCRKHYDESQSKIPDKIPDESRASDN
jgi:internalin A